MTSRFCSGVRSCHGVSSGTPIDFGDLLQLRELRAVMRLAPGLDRALADRLRRIRHDQLHVELDHVAESMARRARTERIVEREQSRLRILVGDPASAAFEAFAEHAGLGDLLRIARHLDREGGAAALPIRCFDGIGQPRPEIAVDHRRSTITWSSVRPASADAIHVIDADGACHPPARGGSRA